MYIRIYIINIGQITRCFLVITRCFLVITRYFLVITRYLSRNYEIIRREFNLKHDTNRRTLFPGLKTRQSKKKRMSSCDNKFNRAIFIVAKKDLRVKVWYIK